MTVKKNANKRESKVSNFLFTPCSSGTVPGPELPTQLWQHAMINIKNDLTIFIGGEEKPYEGYI